MKAGAHRYIDRAEEVGREKNTARHPRPSPESNGGLLLTLLAKHIRQRCGPSATGSVYTTSEDWTTISAGENESEECTNERRKENSSLHDPAPDRTGVFRSYILLAKIGADANHPPMGSAKALKVKKPNPIHERNKRSDETTSRRKKFQTLAAQLEPESNERLPEALCCEKKFEECGNTPPLEWPMVLDRRSERTKECEGRDGGKRNEAAGLASEISVLRNRPSCPSVVWAWKKGAQSVVIAAAESGRQRNVGGAHPTGRRVKLRNRTGGQKKETNVTGLGQA
ncbi:hypothetical protein DFH06DRAFT_1418883 [Mycena polygramma]|nr:hypothetical protein DFH06DRAFT_1418883 [Mycena polygramma]